MASNTATAIPPRSTHGENPAKGVKKGDASARLSISASAKAKAKTEHDGASARTYIQSIRSITYPPVVYGTVCALPGIAGGDLMD
jgi:hypothetical protein